LEKCTDSKKNDEKIEFNCPLIQLNTIYDPSSKQQNIINLDEYCRIPDCVSITFELSVNNLGELEVNTQKSLSVYIHLFMISVLFLNFSSQIDLIGLGDGNQANNDTVEQKPVIIDEKRNENKKGDDGIITNDEELHSRVKQQIESSGIDVTSGIDPHQLRRSSQIPTGGTDTENISSNYYGRDKFLENRRSL
jgi:hypothetical protein